MLYREKRRIAANETKTLTPSIIRATPGASRDSKLYDTLPPPLPPNKRPKETRVYVESGDTLSVARRVAGSSTTNRVGVLNMASEKHPGGGWLRGALAQEEALCIRSTLATTLKYSYYPLPSLGAIWSPNVVVFKDELESDCRMFEAQERFMVGVVSVVGLRHPPLTEDGLDYKKLRDAELLQSKLRQILRIMAGNEISHCTLGALGCGVVAQIFRKVISEEEFAGQIIFAILDTRGSKNSQIFQELLGDNDVLL